MVRHDFSQKTHLSLIVTHKQEFLKGMEIDQASHGSALFHFPKTGEEKKPGQKMFPDRKVTDPSFILHGKTGESLQDGAAQKSAAAERPGSFFKTGMNLDIPHAAGRRTVFQEEAIHFGQGTKKVIDKAPHRPGKVLPCGWLIQGSDASYRRQSG